MNGIISQSSSGPFPGNKARHAPRMDGDEGVIEA